MRPAVRGGMVGAMAEVDRADAPIGHEHCGCGLDPDPTVSTGFLPIGIAVLLLGCAFVLGLFG